MDLIPDFMISMCRVHPRPNINRFHALFYVISVNNMPANDGDHSLIATSSGSTSEFYMFYIEPLSLCIDDIDIVHHRNDRLAIPEGHPVPRCLPAEFHRKVEVCELVNTKYPCYVLLRRVCAL